MIYRFIDYTPKCPKCCKNDAVIWDSAPGLWYCTACGYHFD